MRKSLVLLLLLLAHTVHSVQLRSKLLQSSSIDLETEEGLNEIQNPVTLHVGDVLTVFVEENPSTGFQWDHSESKLTTITHLEGREDRRPHRVGAPHEATFKFKANERGHETIEMIYH